MGGENSDFLTLVIRATDVFLAINFTQASACLSFRVLRTRVKDVGVVFFASCARLLYIVTCVREER